MGSRGGRRRVDAESLAGYAIYDVAYEVFWAKRNELCLVLDKKAKARDKTCPVFKYRTTYGQCEQLGKNAATQCRLLLGQDLNVLKLVNSGAGGDVGEDWSKSAAVRSRLKDAAEDILADVQAGANTSGALAQHTQQATNPAQSPSQSVAQTVPAPAAASGPPRSGLAGTAAQAGIANKVDQAGPPKQLQASQAPAKIGSMSGMADVAQTCHSGAGKMATNSTEAATSASGDAELTNITAAAHQPQATQPHQPASPTDVVERTGSWAEMVRRSPSTSKSAGGADAGVSGRVSRGGAAGGSSGGPQATAMGVQPSSTGDQVTGDQRHHSQAATGAKGASVAGGPTKTSTAGAPSAVRPTCLPADQAVVGAHIAAAAGKATRDNSASSSQNGKEPKSLPNKSNKQTDNPPQTGAPQQLQGQCRSADGQGGAKTAMASESQAPSAAASKNGTRSSADGSSAGPGPRQGKANLQLTLPALSAVPALAASAVGVAASQKAPKAVRKNHYPLIGKQQPLNLPALQLAAAGAGAAGAGAGTFGGDARGHGPNPGETEEVSKGVSGAKGLKAAGAAGIDAFAATFEAAMEAAGRGGTTQGVKQRPKRNVLSGPEYLAHRHRTDELAAQRPPAPPQQKIQAAVSTLGQRLRAATAGDLALVGQQWSETFRAAAAGDPVAARQLESLEAIKTFATQLLAQRGEPRPQAAQHHLPPPLPPLTEQPTYHTLGLVDAPGMDGMQMLDDLLDLNEPVPPPNPGVAVPNPVMLAAATGPLPGSALNMGGSVDLGPVLLYHEPGAGQGHLDEVGLLGLGHGMAGGGMGTAGGGIMSDDEDLAQLL